jgi:hypothetical protein
MDQEKTLYHLLIEKGIPEEQAREIAAWDEAHPRVYYTHPPTQGRTAQEWVADLLKEPEIQKLLHATVYREERLNELDDRAEKEFHGFLSRLDVRQKAYNLAFMLLGSAIVTGLKALEVVTKEASSTLVTIIITATLTDAISNYYKSKDKE